LGIGSGNGAFCNAAESVLSSMHGGSSVLLTPSCSSALEMAARLIRFEPGDEVIVPSYTFVTTVSAFVLNGATPVFCDIDPLTLGLDPSKARELVTPKTRAICLVHYAGVPANPEAFRQLADEYGLVLVEDNAHGLGGTSGDEVLGTFGDLSTLSFHETKNVSCGEGGALVINAGGFLEPAQILREKGTDRTKFLNGRVDKYRWIDNGSSWVLSEILAAILSAQLHDFDSIMKTRRSLWENYREGIEDWASSKGYQILPPDMPHTAHLFYLILNTEEEQQRFLRHMVASGVTAVFHYQPLHLSPAGARWLRDLQQLPVTESVAKTLVRLPLYSSLQPLEQQKTLEAVCSFDS